MIFDVDSQKVFLFGNAKVDYKDITLKAEYIVFDWKKNLITAIGVPDSTGKMIGDPVFIDGSQEFKAKKIIYNYHSKKGKIYELITKQGPGFFHGEEIKMMPDGNMFGRKAMYTTCNHEDPHFEIAVNKVKVIPDKLLVAGRSMLVIAGMPTPLIAPFGLFPLNQNKKTGILFPEFGSDPIRGFNLRHGGYYFALGDYMDLALTGDIYSRGSWRANAASKYRTRYRFNGAVQIDFAETLNGDPLTKEFTKKNDFFIDWSHKQDPKARPYSNFSAKVRAGTSTFHKNNSLDYTNLLTNTYRSSISYNKNFAGTPFNLSSSLSHSQNTNTQIVALTLPSTNLTMNPVYPFKRKVASSKQNWYETLRLSYNGKFENKVTVNEADLFNLDSLDFKTGILHSIPINTSFKVLKFVSITPGVDYKERWAFKTIKKEWIEDGVDTPFHQQTDIKGFKAAREFQTNVKLSTKLYGQLNMKRGFVKAFRHVLTPSMNLEYRPDFSAPSWGYYETVQVDSTGKEEIYSFFDGSVFGAPPKGKRAGMGFALNNNLEMKVRQMKDSVEREKKWRLIPSFNIGTFYNVALDSLRWNVISLRGYTNILGRFKVNFSSTYDLYASNFKNESINKFVYDQNGNPARLLNRNITISTQGFDFGSKDSKNKNQSRSGGRDTQEQLNTINENPDNYVDFNVGWNGSLNYTLRLNYSKDNYRFTNKEHVKYDTLEIVQSLTMAFNIRLTPQWRIDVRSGYDFVQNKITLTQVEIHRDLHCWQMEFKWIPYGNRQGFYFGIKPKAQILQELKLNKKKNWYGN